MTDLRPRHLQGLYDTLLESLPLPRVDAAYAVVDGALEEAVSDDVIATNFSGDIVKAHRGESSADFLLQLFTRYCNPADPVLSSGAGQAPQEHLDNCTDTLGCMPSQEDTDMATKINRAVLIHGKKTWIRANTEQEYADKLAEHLSAGEPVQSAKGKHNFGNYAWNWFHTYSKPNVETATATTYKRQLTLYLIPAFGDRSIEDITTDDIQRLFNGMHGAKATKEKVKTVLGMIMDMAVEDNLITKSPLKSKRLRIAGDDSKPTEPYSVEQMCFLVQNLSRLKQPQDRAYLALQALHPLRPEEVLGLKWSDIDLDAMVLHIVRAVTHPTRNQPEVKVTKTKSSVRSLGLSKIAVQYLVPGNPDDFVIGGAKPLSYQQVKRMCDRIQREIGFSEKITPIRFRTTVLTDLYDQTHDIKATQAAAGHTTADMTLKYYVKGRNSVADTATKIDQVYGGTPS